MKEKIKRISKRILILSGICFWLMILQGFFPIPSYLLSALTMMMALFWIPFNVYFLLMVLLILLISILWEMRVKIKRENSVGSNPKAKCFKGLTLSIEPSESQIEVV